MSEGRDYKRSRKAWELAGEQHGVVARRQLLALGFNAREIEHRVARRRLHPVMRGVYAVGWPRLTRERRWIAAVLACGEGAQLSHRSAAALWEIGVERKGIIDVSVRRRAELKRRGLHVRGRPSLTTERITTHGGIPVTTPMQTLIDLSTELAPIRVERAVNEADKHDLIDPEVLRVELDRYFGEPGVKDLRTILDKRTFRLSDSDLEVLFRPIALEAGLPLPLTKEIVNGFEVDFFFPGLGLVIETDGLRYHRTPSSQTRDAKRDRAHTLAGMTPLRFTHHEIKYEPTRVRSELQQIATTLKRPSDIDHT
jgi:very-short-patch-repair endonuclease